MTLNSLSPAARLDAEAVLASIGQPKRLGIAFSGGVDSATLLAVAVAGLGHDRVVAFLGISPSLAPDERQIAHDVARQIGVDIVEVATHEIDNPDYRANDVDRCFFCKDELFSLLRGQIATDHGLDTIAFGENADDAQRLDRPGSRAGYLHRILRPLAAAGLSKTQVRRLARELGLPVADKPAAPCLASRIPHGEAVTAEKLVAIGTAEAALRRLGFSDSRVRHHGGIARIEIPDAEIPRVADPELRAAALKAIKAAGFRHVTLDLAGMQSGSFTLLELERHRD